MMPYKGYYWTIFAPLMKKSIRNRFGKDMADRAIRQGKIEYRSLLQQADDVGKGNPMAMNAYFAYVFCGAWLGSGKKLTPDDMALVMQDVLHNMQPFFGMVNLNKKPKYWYASMKKFEKWAKGKETLYPTNWSVHFDEKLHEDGSFYYFTSCPICATCQRLGIPEIMSSLCSTDSLMFQMQHGVLHRDQTIANGDCMCDYWIVGDQVKNPK